jgi:DNA-binding NtrC family response regulator
MELLKTIKTVAPQTGVIILTDYASVDYCLQSMTLGVFEYLTKPVHARRLKKNRRRFFQPFAGLYTERLPRYFSRFG